MFRFLIAWLFRVRSLTMVGGGTLGALAAGQIEFWLRGSWSGGVATVAACVGASLAFVAVGMRGSPITYGSARFQSRRDLRSFRCNEGLIVGREDRVRGHLLRYDGPGHLLTIAPTRAGKGVGAIIPNLLTTDRPVIVIDPKGENFAVAGQARSRFGPVYALDPFGITGAHSVSFNPLTAVDPSGNRFLEDATAIAEAMVVDSVGGAGDDAHWTGEARALITGMVLHCVSAEPPERRNIGQVREYLTLGPDRAAALLAAMRSSNAAGGLVARAANRRLAQNEREAASVLSTAQRHTHFLDSPLIVESTARSDFTFQAVAEQNGTIFLVLPPDRLHTYARWLRLLVGRAIVELMQGADRRKPVLLMLDEAAALGRMKPIEQALGLAAGYGVQLWTIFQDLHQVRAVYGRTAETFLSNAGIVQAFNVNDIETAGWLARTLGVRTVRTPPVAGRAGASGWVGRSLLTPDEILSMPPDRMLVLPQKGRPILARKPRYYEDGEFAEMFEVEARRESGA